MNDVVNLNRFRKKKARDEKAASAAENRARFGQTKSQRQAERQREALRRHQLEQHELSKKDNA